MAMMYVVDSLAEVYKKLGKDLLKYGNKVSPRGMETLEFDNIIISIKYPKNNLVYNPNRKFSLIYGINESFNLVLPKNELRYFTAFNKNMSKFSDDRETLNGAYGYRIGINIEPIIKMLKEDQNTRQAVVSIYNNYDITVNSKDIPCTLNLVFSIRKDRLNMTVNMRSNDVIWGLPYDVFMFTNLQQVIANTLGVKLGRYNHSVVSMHVYKEHYDLLKELSEGDTKPYMCILRDDFDTYYHNAVKSHKIIDKKLTPDTVKKLDMFNSLLMREMVYKGEYDELWLDKCGKIPMFARPFTKRWDNNSEKFE